LRLGDEVQARIPQKSPVSPVGDFLAEAHVLYQKGDLEGLRVLYKTAKAKKATPDLLSQIEELAKGLKK